ncbi:hypothetical protein B0H11DRAFT_2302651 [Mycena galericulata]|nr:hypothetical protein B0H11DRAFT_2302651 [Mycena galericulata]
MAEQAEVAFLRVFVNTLATQPVTYPDDYQQPPQNSLKRVPVLQTDVDQISLPAPPRRKQALSSSSAPISLTFKSLKPPASYTLAVPPTDSIAAVKARLAAQPAGPPVDAQRLLFKGKALADAKLLKEYPIQDGDTVNLVLKATSSISPTTAMATDPKPSIALTLDSPSPSLSQSSGGGKRHQRIPSVVLSPSPSSETPPGALGLGAERDITLTLDTDTSPTLPPAELSSYHTAIADPEFWERLLAFLRTTLPSPAPADALHAFETFLNASKGTLSASEVARIRDWVGVVGMSGT